MNILENIELMRASERGVTENSWLLSRHSFSFGSYQNLQRLNFGTLRVVNEDWVKPGQGFPKHAHENMEILTLVLEGTLTHEDNLGNRAVIKPGQIQHMSAGKGIVHSEYNASKTEPLHFVQIWIFPSKRALTPSYEQIDLKGVEKKDDFHLFCAPLPTAGALRINQDARLFLGNFAGGSQKTLSLRSRKYGLFFFVIGGEVALQGHSLHRGDAAQLTKVDQIEFKVLKQAQLLVIEVPMSTL